MATAPSMHKVVVELKRRGDFCHKRSGLGTRSKNLGLVCHVVTIPSARAPSIEDVQLTNGHYGLKLGSQSHDGVSGRSRTGLQYRCKLPTV